MSRSTTPASSVSRKSPTTDAGVQVSPQGHKKENPQQMGQRGRQQNANRPPQQRNNQQQMQERQGGPRPNWGQPQNRGMQVRPRGRGRSNPGYRTPGQAAQPPKPKNPIKFDSEYDFEQANTEFEELRSKLAKVKIEDGASKPVEQNGEVEKKDDSGNETGAGEGEVEEESETTFYDCKKSFFDNISCEAVERSKGRSQKTDWRTERKLNSETFGVASARRGGFRGRGGYYNRGMGGYRGGYRNYRNQGQNRNPRQNQPFQEQVSQQPQSSSSAQPATKTAPPSTGTSGPPPVPVEANGK